MKYVAFLPRGQDSSGMLTYDESILVAFASQRIAHQSESTAQGQDGFPCLFKGIVGFQLPGFEPY